MPDDTPTSTRAALGALMSESEAAHMDHATDVIKKVVVDLFDNGGVPLLALTTSCAQILLMVGGMLMGADYRRNGSTEQSQKALGELCGIVMMTLDESARLIRSVGRLEQQEGGKVH